MKGDGGQRDSRKRPRWLPAVVALAGVILTASAGNWQLDRAHEKERLREAYERGASDAPILVGASPVVAADVRLRRVEVTGSFVPQAMVLLDNRIRNGQPGYEVIMPVSIAGSSMHVLVDRGWIGAGRDRSRLPDVKTPEAPVKVVGIATVPGRFFELANTQDSGVVWQNLTIERYREHRGLQVQPVVVQQRNEIDDGLLRSTEPPDFGTAKHYGYAGQWFLFCGLIVFLFVYFHVRTSRSQKDPAHDPAAGHD